MSHYRERLKAVIPGGAHTYSRGSDQFPSNAPEILVSGEGAYVRDPLGRKFLDYGMALRSVTLGYANPRVNAAVYEAVTLGNSLTLPTITELEAAELLVELIPSAEMVKFAKNGSNATTAAAKIARAFTGREYICVPRQHPFFSFDDWFISTTSMRRGIPSSLPIRTLVFDYNDIDSLANLFDAYPDSIAGVMLEPSTAITPCSQACGKTLSEYSPCRECSSENFLHQVQRLCQAQGALFILDEMITGFRWSLSGAGSYFGVEPDLCTFGKAMSNGFSVAAVAGRREVMEVGSIDRPGQERTFLLSSTHGGEMSGLRAFMETVTIYRETDVVSHLWSFGAALKSGLQEVAQAANASHLFQIEGPPVSLNYVLRDLDGESSLPLRTLFSQEMIRLGVLMPWISASQSHGERELQLTLEAAVQALAIVRRAAYTNVADFLEGPAVKPVFRKFN